MIRRPLLFVSLGLVSAILVAHYCGNITGMLVLACLFFIRLKVFNGQKAGSIQSLGPISKHEVKIVSYILIVAFAAGLINYAVVSDRLEEQRSQLMALSNENGVSDLTGKIKTINKKQNDSDEIHYQLVVLSEYGKTIVGVYDDSLEEGMIPGSFIDVKGSMSIPQCRRNPNCFDYNLYLKSQGITTSMTSNNIFLIDEEEYYRLQEDAENSGDLSRNISHSLISNITNNTFIAFITSWKSELEGKLYESRENFIQSIEEHTNKETAAMVKSIMYGDKGMLDEDILETFQKNGTAHILAVSGLHIGIIYGLILRLWILVGSLSGGRLCGKRGMAFFIFNAAFFGCYIIMSNYSPSVVRAVVMVLLHTFANLTNKRYDLNNAAFVVIIAVLINNPYMLFNTGFQMSLLAVLTLTLVIPFLKRVYTGVLAGSMAVQIGLGPYMVYTFNNFSVISVFINVPVIFLAGIIVPLGILSMVLSMAVDAGAQAEGLEYLIANMMKVPIDLLNWLNAKSEVSGVTSFQVASPKPWVVAAYYMGLLAFATEEGRLRILRSAEALKPRLKYIFRVFIIILVISLCFGRIVDDGFRKCDFTFVDVGQGNCLCIKTESGLLGKEKCYLIDGGGNVNYNVGKQVLRSYLLKNGITHVDGAIVTHLHTDHYKGICELAKEGMVDRIYVYEGNRPKEDEIVRDTGLDADEIRYIYAGEELVLGSRLEVLGRDEVKLKVLWPAKKTESEYVRALENEEDENASSLIMKITNAYEPLVGEDSSISVLVTADVGEEGEAQLIESIESRASAVGGSAGNSRSRSSENAGGELGESAGEIVSGSGGSNLSGSTVTNAQNATTSELGADILSVGHHGSKTSSSDEFLDAVNAGIAVIQVGKNNYGHPTPEVLQRLADRNIEVYRNDESGAVGFVIKRGKVAKVKRMIE